MNILYIGTYRTNDDSGAISRLYLKDIAEKHNITARPVFISNNNLTDVDSSIKDMENNLLKKYDCCIQNIPINMLTYNNNIEQNIALIAYNYLTSINDYAIIKQLQLMNTIIVNNHEDEAIILRSGIDKKIKKIDCPIDTDSLISIDKTFNFGIHDNHHKFYLFANYKEDIEVIHKVILAFYMAFRCREGHSLVMVLEGSEQDKEHLSQTRSDLKKQLEIVEYNDSINELYIFDTLSHNDKLTIHNSCNTFLDLCPTSTLLQKQHALFFGNNIIDRTNTNTIELPYRGINGNSMYFPGDFIESATTNSISINMINFGVSNNKNPKTNLYSSRLSSVIA